MYVNQKAESLSLKMDYSENKNKGKSQKSLNVEIKYSGIKVSGKTSDSADITALQDKQQDSPVEDVESYIKDSVTRIMQNVASKTDKIVKGQAETVMAEYQTMSISVTISVTTEQTQEDSKYADLLNGDGYFGVKKTSQRIFDLAAAISGGDPEKLAEAKDSITKGFEMARNSLGGTLPQISEDTYGAVMDKMDSYIDYISGQETYA